jgi:DNA-binding response OmpR family regulator
MNAYSKMFEKCSIFKKMYNYTAKILIILDENNASNFKTAFEAENYNVLKVSGNLSTPDFVKNEKTELILLDIRLADIDSCNVCRQLKANSRYTWIQ